MADKTEAMDNLIAQDADLIDVASKLTEADREVLIRISNSDDETAQRIRRGLIYTWEVGEIARHRLEERAQIVAWLRKLSGYDRTTPMFQDRRLAYQLAALEFSNAIEAGEHLK